MGISRATVPFSKRCEALLEEELGAARVLLTTSCTHALELSALLLDIQPDDEVIVPTFTFVSTVNAFALFGARPVFCDIRSDTLNMDESVVPLLISERDKGCGSSSLCRGLVRHERDWARRESI